MMDQEESKRRKHTGFFTDESKIYELGFGGIQTYFIVFDSATGKCGYVNEIIIDRTTVLVPLFDEMIEKRVLHLPSCPMPYGSENALYTQIRGFIHKYLAVSEFYERLAAYYVLFTWLYDRFNTLPYLRALGDYGTGKSRFLQVIGSLCYRPVFASGATTVSPIFRMIDKYKGTLIIDEADFKNSDSEADITKILNCGYQAGFPVIRSEQKDKSFDPCAYEVYGPKLIATRKRYTDKALESRCLTEDMDDKWRPDVPIILPEDFWQEALEIRNQLLQWRFEKYFNVKLREDLINESIEPRLNQISMPLASIISEPGMLEELKDFSERYNKNIIVERGQLLEAEILQAIMDLFLEWKEDPSMKEIAAKASKNRDEKVTPKRVGWIVRNKLKLPTENRRNVLHLIWDEAKINKLCEKYGIVSCEDVRIERMNYFPWDDTVAEDADESMGGL